MIEEKDENHIVKDYREDHTIIATLSKILFSIIIIFGFYIHFHGDIRAGGGFQSGAIFSVAILLHDLLQYHAHYHDLMCEKLPATKIAITGLSIFSFLVFFPQIINGNNVLSYSFLSKNKMYANFIGMSLFETAISLIIFASFTRIIRAFFHVLKKDNIFN